MKYPRLPVKCHAWSRDTQNQHPAPAPGMLPLYSVPTDIATLWRWSTRKYSCSIICLSIWKTLPEGLTTLCLFWFELPCLQMSLTGNRPSLLVDKPQVLRLKQAKPCWVKKFSGFETLRIIWKSGLSVPLLYLSDYPSQCQSLVKHLRTHSIHLAGPHVIIFFQIVTIMSTEGTITAHTIN